MWAPQVLMMGVAWRLCKSIRARACIHRSNGPGGMGGPSTLALGSCLALLAGVATLDFSLAPFLVSTLLGQI